MAFTAPRKAVNNQGNTEVRTKSIPASVRGWNARDAVADMPEDMALTLTNIFPNPTNLSVREGTDIFVVCGGGGQVTPVPIKTLMVYRPASGSQKLWAARGTGIYDYSTWSSTSPVAYSAYQEVSFNNFTGATATGLTPATTYTTRITIDGVANNISVLGSDATTYDDLLNQINSQITGAVAGFTVNDGSQISDTSTRITVVSNTVGTGGSIAILDTGVHHLFSSVSGFAQILSAQAATAATLGGLTNGLAWQYVNMATQGITYLFACNGTDHLYRYDSSNGWKDTSTAGAWQITGLPAAPINVAEVHNRLWMVVPNSNIIYFLDANAIAGAVSNLDVGPLLDKGGSIIAVGGWSTDSGVGMQEYTVLISSQGQAVVYQGIDPTNAALWQLVGTYNIGRPVGYKCMTRLGNDLLILTTDGLIPASKGFATDRSNERIAVTTNIQNAVTSAIVSVGADTIGWQTIFYPEAQQLIMNVPGASQQFVMNTIHKAWCLFSGWNATSFEIFNTGGTGITITTDLLMWSDIYGNVFYTSPNPAFTSSKDYYTGSIAFEWQPAFNSIGDPNRMKEVTMMRPNFVYNSSSSISMQVGIDYDYVAISPTGTVVLPTVSGQSASRRNTTVASSPIVRLAWMTMSATGYAFAPHFVGSISGVSRPLIVLTFNAIDVVWRPGGIQSA